MPRSKPKTRKRARRPRGPRAKGTASPPPSPPPPSAAQVRAYELILRGEPPHRVREFLCENFPAEDWRAALEGASRLVERVGLEPRERVRAWCVAVTRDLVRQLIAEGKPDKALNGIRLLNDLVSEGGRVPPPAEEGELLLDGPEAPPEIPPGKGPVLDV